MRLLTWSVRSCSPADEADCCHGVRRGAFLIQSSLSVMDFRDPTVAIVDVAPPGLVHLARA